VDLPGDQDAARFGYAFQAGRDVDAFAVNPLIIKDIAEVDADPELESGSVGSEAIPNIESALTAVIALAK
jgi:hypothetical protein